MRTGAWHTRGGLRGRRCASVKGRTKAPWRRHCAGYSQQRTDDAGFSRQRQTMLARASCGQTTPVVSEHPALRWRAEAWAPRWHAGPHHTGAMLSDVYRIW